MVVSMLFLEGDEDGAPRVLEQEMPAEWGMAGVKVGRVSDRIVVVAVGEGTREEGGEEAAPERVVRPLGRFVWVVATRREDDWPREVSWPAGVRPVSREWPRSVPAPLSVESIRALSRRRYVRAPEARTDQAAEPGPQARTR